MLKSRRACWLTISGIRPRFTSSDHCLPCSAPMHGWTSQPWHPESCCGTVAKWRNPVQGSPVPEVTRFSYCSPRPTAGSCAAIMMPRAPAGSSNPSWCMHEAPSSRDVLTSPRDQEDGRVDLVVENVSLQAQPGSIRASASGRSRTVTGIRAFVHIPAEGDVPGHTLAKVQSLRWELDGLRKLRLELQAREAPRVCTSMRASPRALYLVIRATESPSRCWSKACSTIALLLLAPASSSYRSEPRTSSASCRQQSSRTSRPAVATGWEAAIRAAGSPSPSTVRERSPI